MGVSQGVDDALGEGACGEAGKQVVSAEIGGVAAGILQPLGLPTGQRGIHIAQRWFNGSWLLPEEQGYSRALPPAGLHRQVQATGN